MIAHTERVRAGDVQITLLDVTKLCRKALILHWIKYIYGAYPYEENWTSLEYMLLEETNMQCILVMAWCVLLQGLLICHF